MIRYKAILRDNKDFTREIEMSGEELLEWIDIPVFPKNSLCTDDSYIDRLAYRVIRFRLVSIDREEEQQDMLSGIPRRVATRIFIHESIIAYYEEEEEIASKPISPKPSPEPSLRRYLDLRKK